MLQVDSPKAWLQSANESFYVISLGAKLSMKRGGQMSTPQH
jgi:hypothetical protein